MDNALVIAGNLTGDPELRFTPSGAAVANFTIAHTPRVKNSSGDWEDGETVFQRCTVWRSLAENIAESLTKGTRVLAVGRLKARSYETREGEKRNVIELEVDNIGPSLQYATARVSRQAGKQGGGAATQSRPQPTRPAPVNDDPFASAAGSDEPPF